MSGMVVIVATWNSWISYQNVYAGLLVLSLLLLLAHCQNVANLSLFYTFVDVHLN